MSDIPYLEFGILMVVGLIALGLAIYIFTRYQQTTAIKIFGLLALSDAGWILFNGLGLIMDRGGQTMPFFFRMTYVFSSFLFALLFLFTLHYPYKRFEINWRFNILLFSVPTLISGLVLFSDGIIMGFDQARLPQSLEGSIYWVFALYVILLFVWILIELINKIRSEQGMYKWHLNMFFWGILLSGIIGILFNLVIPLIIDVSVPNWIGPSASIIWLGLMVCVIRRRV
ncbi:MAG: histidine kinase N-terminal 7TM domain-containing protein [bacterium]